MAKKKKLKPPFTIFFLLGIAVFLAGFFFVSSLTSNTVFEVNVAQENEEDQDKKVYAKSFSPPDVVRAIYVASPAVFNNRFEEFTALIDETELNSVVITMKSAGGLYKGEGVTDLVNNLKDRRIYPIARLAIFQDNVLARSRPDLALKNKEGGLWRDSSGAYWMDPASKEVWDYSLDISKRMIDLGFMELNFDYIRFPSDGALSDIRYPFWLGKETKADVMKEFFAHLTKELKEYNQDIMLSADIFAYSLLSHVDDSGIGQRVEDAAIYFDVVAPMIYPSHYSSGNFGFANPAAHPYEVTLGTLEQGKIKLDALEGEKGIMRPWLQAFNIGAIYDSKMVHLEMQAVIDAGFKNGWMLWNPRSAYPRDLFIDIPKPIP